MSLLFIAGMAFTTVAQGLFFRALSRQDSAAFTSDDEVLDEPSGSCRRGSSRS